MKALVLNGARKDDDAVDDVCNVVSSALGSRRYEVDAVNLARAKKHGVKDRLYARPC